MLDTYQAYRKQFADAGKGMITDSPTHLDIELASVCNFRCPMCPQAEKEVAFKKGFMPTEVAMDILIEARCIGVKSIKLNWRGESTLHPDFPEIVDRAMALGFEDVMLNTNGGWETNHIWIHGAVSKLDTVIFSIDTLDPEKAKKLRPGKPLWVVIDNLRKLSEAGPIPRLRVNFTLQKENADEVEAISAFCHARNIEISIRPVFPRNPPKKNEYYDDTKIKVLGRKNCGFPFQRLVIAHDGMVAPCCVPWSNDLWVGDIKTQTLKEIWEGEDLKKIREDALSTNYQHPTCVGCTSWASYEVQRV